MNKNWIVASQQILFSDELTMFLYHRCYTCKNIQYDRKQPGHTMWATSAANAGGDPQS
jgi:hypothetical protein